MTDETNDRFYLEAFAFLRGAAGSFCRVHLNGDEHDNLQSILKEADDIAARGFLEHLKNPGPKP